MERRPSIGPCRSSRRTSVLGGCATCPAPPRPRRRTIFGPDPGGRPPSFREGTAAGSPHAVRPVSASNEGLSFVISGVDFLTPMVSARRPEVLQLFFGLHLTVTKRLLYGPVGLA